MVTIERTLNDVLSQLQRKGIDERVTYQGKIQFVDYSTRHIVVKVKGFGTIKRVNVQRGIQLGTTDRPVILRGDVATIFQKPSGRWVCSSIIHKDHCATSPLPGEVIVDTSNEYISSNSIITQQLASLDLPFEDLRFPPIESLGQLTLPDFRFPDTFTFLCGIPPCTDCGTPAVGKAIVISTDVDHPLCYKYDFRLGGCTGSPGFLSTFVYDSTLFGGTPVEQRNAKLHTLGSTTYAATFSAANSYGLFQVINVSNPLVPVVAGSASIPVTISTEELGGIQVHGNYVYLHVNKPVFNNFSSLTYVYDVSIPASPTLVHTWTWSGFIWGVRDADRNDMEIYESGGTTCMVSTYRYQLAGVNDQGFKILDITNPASPTTVSTTINPVGLLWTNIDYSSGFVIMSASGGSSVSGRIYVYDVTVPALPVFEGSFNLGNGLSIKSLRSNGSYVFVGRAGTNRMYILDLADPTSLVLLSTTVLTAQPNDMEPCSNYLDIAQFTNGEVVAYDVSAPALPVLSGSDTIADFRPVSIQVLSAKAYLNGVRNIVPRYPTLAILDA